MNRNLILILFWAVCCRDIVAASEFIPLGDFPQGGFHSQASAISAEGSTVVGAGTRFTFGLPPTISDAFRWTRMSGLVNLQSAPPFDAPITGAGGVSYDGSVVVGGMRNQFHNDPFETTQAFRWTALDGLVGLGYLPGGMGRFSGASDVSADGAFIVGASDSPNGLSEAFYWTKDTGIWSGWEISRKESFIAGPRQCQTTAGMSQELVGFPSTIKRFAGVPWMDSSRLLDGIQLHFGVARLPFRLMEVLS
jgi:hypothetical protein